MKIKNYSHVLISKVGIEDLGDNKIHDYMVGYLDNDNVVVYDFLCFWL